MKNYHQLERRLQKILKDAVESGEERGMQLSVREHGQEIICLQAGGFPEDGLAPVFSVGKGIMTTAFHCLAQRGTVCYDFNVGDYWPEFACKGKEQLKIWQVMSHQSGMAHLPEGIDSCSERLADWDAMCRALANAEPSCPPGTRCEYQGITYSWLLGETAHRADGRDFRRIINDEVLAPLGLENQVFFGLTPEAERRFIPIDTSHFPPASSPWVAKFSSNSTIMHGCIPAANAVTNASAISKIYASTLDEVDAVRLLTPDTLARATTFQRGEDEAGSWAQFGLGYALCGPQDDLGRRYGHGGAAGSEGFADKATGLAVGFIKVCQSPAHPIHLVRDQISSVLGLPVRHW